MCNFEHSKISKLMDRRQLLDRALKKEFLSAAEGQFLFENIPTAELMFVAHELRKIQVPGDYVTWQIDRNVNTTNACTANCKFCNFFRHPKHDEVYITNLETYKLKIEETINNSVKAQISWGHMSVKERVELLKKLIGFFTQYPS